jgi:hypothetical protein
MSSACAHQKFQPFVALRVLVLMLPWITAKTTLPRQVIQLA